MEGHLVRLARRARGEPLGFAPTNTGPPPLQPGITDELQGDAQPAEQSFVAVDSPGSSMPLRRERPEPRIQRDTAPPSAARVRQRRPPPTGTLVAPLPPPLEEGRVRVGASISPAPRPSLGGAPVIRTVLPGAPVDSQPVDVSEITSEILEENPHPDLPPQAEEGDVRLGHVDPKSDAPPLAGKGDFRVAVSANMPMKPVAATGRARSRSGDAVAESAGDEAVRITIGRIEVRAPAASPPPPTAEAALAPRLSLAEYLQQRDREGGR